MVNFGILSLRKQIYETCFQDIWHVAVDEFQVPSLWRDCLSPPLRWARIAGMTELLGINGPILVLAYGLFSWPWFFIIEKVAFLTQAINKMLPVPMRTVRDLALLCRKDLLVLFWFFFESIVFAEYLPWWNDPLWTQWWRNLIFDVVGVLFEIELGHGGFRTSIREAWWRNEFSLRLFHKAVYFFIKLSWNSNFIFSLKKLVRIVFYCQYF